jgi:hypothetical protein
MFPIALYQISSRLGCSTECNGLQLVVEDGLLVPFVAEIIDNTDIDCMPLLRRMKRQGYARVC